MKSFLRKTAIAAATLAIGCSALAAPTFAAYTGTDKTEPIGDAIAPVSGAPELVISEINFEIGDTTYIDGDNYVFDITYGFTNLADNPTNNYSLILQYAPELYVEGITKINATVEKYDTVNYRNSHLFTVNYTTAEGFTSDFDCFTVTFSTDKETFDNLVKANLNEEKGVYEYQMDLVLYKYVKVAMNSTNYTADAGNNNGFIYGYSETAPAVTTTEEPVVTTTEEPVVTTTEEPVVTTTEQPVDTTPTPTDTTPTPTETTATGTPPETGVGGTTSATTPLAVAALVAIVCGSAVVVNRKKND